MSGKPNYLHMKVLRHHEPDEELGVTLWKMGRFGVWLQKWTQRCLIFSVYVL